VTSPPSPGRVAVSVVDVFFGGEQASCAGASAASMAVVRRVPGRRGGPRWRCCAMWRVQPAASSVEGVRHHRRLLLWGMGTLPKPLLWSLPMVEVGVVLREHGRSWCASTVDGRAVFGAAGCGLVVVVRAPVLGLWPFWRSCPPISPFSMVFLARLRAWVPSVCRLWSVSWSSLQ
jgi:hypothetical protein